LEDELKLTDSDVLIIEFDAHTLPPKMGSFEAVGIHGDLSLVRGTCQDATDRPNQAMQRTPTRRSP
jgi:hypothetical protein